MKKQEAEESMEKPVTKDVTPKPSIGRIVHYKNLKGDTQAALVTGLYHDVKGHQTDDVSLTVFTPSGEARYNRVKFACKPTQECWSWPERN